MAVAAISKQHHEVHGSCPGRLQHPVRVVGLAKCGLTGGAAAQSEAGSGLGHLHRQRHVAEGERTGAGLGAEHLHRLVLRRRSACRGVFRPTRRRSALRIAQLIRPPPSARRRRSARPALRPSPRSPRWRTPCSGIGPLAAVPPCCPPAAGQRIAGWRPLPIHSDLWRAVAQPAAGKAGTGWLPAGSPIEVSARGVVTGAESHSALGSPSTPAGSQLRTADQQFQHDRHYQYEFRWPGSGCRRVPLRGSTRC